MTNGEAFALAGVLITLILGILGLVRYLLGEIEKGDEGNRIERQKSIDELHSRINDVKRDYVRRDDFSDRMERVEETFRSARSEMQMQFSQMYSRLDTLIALILKRNDEK